MSFVYKIPSTQMCEEMYDCFPLLTSGFVQTISGGGGLMYTAIGVTCPLVVGGWMAGEPLSEQRMGQACDACGVLLVLLMGRGRGSALPPRPSFPSPHPICPVLTGSEANYKSASVV